MAHEIKEVAYVNETGPHFDPFVIQKWLAQGNTEKLRRLVSLEKFIRHIHATAASKETLQKGLSPSQSGELSDLFFATVRGLSQGSRIPNVWQIHFLKLIKKCGYADDEIVRVVNILFREWPTDAKEHMNIAARHLSLGTIFDKTKK